MEELYSKKKKEKTLILTYFVEYLALEVSTHADYLCMRSAMSNIT